MKSSFFTTSLYPSEILLPWITAWLPLPYPQSTTVLPVRSSLSFSSRLSSPTKTETEYEFPTSSGAIIELPMCSLEVAHEYCFDFMNFLLYSLYASLM